MFINDVINELLIADPLKDIIVNLRLLKDTPKQL